MYKQQNLLFTIFYTIYMDIFNKHNWDIKFKAHTYIIKPKTNKITIQTDNKPYLGSSPYLITSDNNSKQEMTEENKKYSNIKMFCFKQLV